jgi:hypothetical protein
VTLARRCFIVIAIEYTIREVQEYQKGMELNGTHQVMASAADVNLLGKNINTIKNPRTLITH